MIFAHKSATILYLNAAPGDRVQGMTLAGMRRYAAFRELPVAAPGYVGCHWFQYQDQPITGRFDSESLQY